MKIKSPHKLSIFQLIVLGMISIIEYLLINVSKMNRYKSEYIKITPKIVQLFNNIDGDDRNNNFSKHLWINLLRELEYQTQNTDDITHLSETRFKFFGLRYDNNDHFFYEQIMEIINMFECRLLKLLLRWFIKSQWCVVGGLCDCSFSIFLYF